MQHREACNELHPGSAGAESTPRAHLTGTPTRGFLSAPLKLFLRTGNVLAWWDIGRQGCRIITAHTDLLTFFEGETYMRMGTHFDAIL